MGTTMSQPAKPVKGTKPTTGPRKTTSSSPRVNHYLHFTPIVRRVHPHPTVQQCDSFRRFWSACPLSRDRRHGPTAAFSSFQTPPTATGSTSAWHAVKSAARTQPSPIASRGTSRRRPPTAASIRTTSRAPFRKLARIAAMQSAANTSRSPASARHVAVRIFAPLFPHPTFVVLVLHLVSPAPEKVSASRGFQYVFGLDRNLRRNAAAWRNHRTIAAETT